MFSCIYEAIEAALWTVREEVIRYVIIQAQRKGR